MNWRQLRDIVWERDKGICGVCKEEVSYEYYECGHLIDRCAGGEDTLDNLVVMCNFCNRGKPVHETIEEYQAWVEGGGVYQVLEEIIRRRIEGLRPDQITRMLRRLEHGD